MGGAAARLSCCAHYAMVDQHPQRRLHSSVICQRHFLCYPIRSLCSSWACQSRASQRRFFDMVLLSHELEMASIRINELIQCVDAMVFDAGEVLLRRQPQVSRVPAGLPPRLPHGRI